MRRLLFSLTLMMMLPALAFGQMKFEDYVRSIPANTTGKTVFEKKTIITEGTPFTKEGWMTGKFHRGNLATATLKFRLNHFDGFIEVENNGEIYALEDAAVEWIEVNSPQPMILRNGYDTGREKGVDESSLFHVLHEGSVSLLRRENVRKQEDLASYGTATQTDRFVHSEIYYALTDDGFKKIKLREKDILRLFPRKIRSDIEDYAKNNRMDFENEAHAAMIMQYAESLNSES